MNHAFLQYFRCPSELARFQLSGPLATDPSYFQINGMTCYGRPDKADARTVRAGARLAKRSARRGQDCYLPSIPTRWRDNLRMERYRYKPPLLGRQPTDPA